MDWAPANLRAWHRAHAPDLAWLDHPARHLFRWRGADARWHVSARRFSRADALARQLAATGARDAYVGTAAWLDPVELPRLRDRTRAAPVLLDHFVVFDIDRPPFCMPRLERARRDAVALLDWLRATTRLELVHAVFSGSKGFHLVLRDPDRSPFAIPDPRSREQAVRESRAALLTRAIAAGHDVDPTVTADTRRVVRLPGTLHGATGWAAVALDEPRLRAPTHDWLRDVPRHPRALKLPRTAPFRLPRLRLRRDGATQAQAAETRLELQASTHVVGTSDRQSPLFWTHHARLAAVQRALARAGVGPVLAWRRDDRALVLVPRALPRDALGALIRRTGAVPESVRGARLGHAWVSVAPQGDALEPLPSTYAACAHPWSRPHLALARRLGHSVAHDGGDACGAREPAVRLVEIR